MRLPFELSMFACEPRIELFQAIQLVAIYFLFYNNINNNNSIYNINNNINN